MLHDLASLPAPLLAVCAALTAGAMYCLGIAAGTLCRELERRRTFRQIADIQNSIARHDAMMAEAEREYLARMGLTSKGECNA